MDSTQIKFLIEAYSDVYAEPEVDCQDLYDSILNLCIIENYFDTLEECEEFSETLIVKNLVEDFVNEILEHYGISDIDSLNESVEYLGENKVAALRAVINALSAGGRLKAGLKAGTALGKKPESVVKGAAASTSIRSARSARPVAKPELPGKYAAMQFKKGIEKSIKTPALPPAKTPAAPAKMPSTLRKDIRATGPGGDARTQRLASQAAPGSGVSPKVSKMADGASALNAARRAMAGAAAAGIAAGAAAPLVKDTAKKSSPESSVNKYNTMDSDGKVRSRLKVGPKTVGTGSVAGDFDVAFKKARTGGAKEFEFKGKKYTTKMAEESVDTFDLVADMLLSEGYVETYEDALIMMDALDESALARLAAGAIKNVIKTGGSKLSKTQLPPKVDKAFQLVKQSMIKQYGPEGVLGTPQQKYAAAARAAELKKNPPPKPKPRDPYPDDVYSKNSLGGIRGYRSGD
jgi:hypothetical protein